ncbi:50S ribosomal protein L23 [Pajaroellobacter abortibovis]|uniref:Large ribosomal subunit protein uL23 n=1 Tax=Pajaroellobacter abortibovis TaxID=1882918 RepID=A0A1L6MY51_9BACT|nr:50S ribosomal protein L23 [Pajaroellobacter abortibovis]APS00429.1 50S ribosomal protein L23 [Pajaroellobacter abortibovis]
MRIDQIVCRPIGLTEKAMQLRSLHQVVFEVHRLANKMQIKRAIERLFSVKVEQVNTLIMRGKERRMGRGYGKMKNWKKAIVTLGPGVSLDFFRNEFDGSSS